MHYMEITEHYVQKAERLAGKTFFSPSYQSMIARSREMKKNKRKTEWPGLSRIIFLLGFAKTLVS